VDGGRDFLDNGKEHPVLTSKEDATNYYKICNSSVCNHNDKIKQKVIRVSQKFNEDVY